MAEILIVDDEEDICRLITGFMAKEGHNCTCSKSGMEAIRLFKTQNFDLVIIDVMMEGIDGFTASREMLAVRKVPIIILSALSSETDKLYGFEIGIEDYVVKPFSPRELMARVNVILRRYSKSDDDAKMMLEYGGLVIDRNAHTVSIDGVRSDLTLKEYEVLVYLCENEGRVMSRRQIIDSIWGDGYYTGERIVDWQVKLLRKKLGGYSEWIHTYRGVGYKFECEK